jgi:hypothetical protein
MSILGILIFSLLGYLLFRWWKINIKIPYWKWVFPGALAVRIFSAIALGLLYSKYWNGGDTWSFHQNALNMLTLWDTNSSDFFRFLLTNQLPQGNWEIFYLNEPRSLLFSKTIALSALALGRSYYTIALFFAFISFLGAFYYFQIFARYFPKLIFANIVSILFLPSLVLWTSGILKETISMAAILLMLALFIDYFYRKKLDPWQIGLLFIAMTAFASLKYYYAMLFFPFYIATFFSVNVVRYWKLSIHYFWVYWFVFLVIFGLIGTQLHPNLHLGRIAEVIYENNQIYKIEHDPEKIVYYDLDGTWKSVFRSAPLALIAGLFTPLPLLPNNLFAWLALIESVIFLLAAAFSLVFLEKGWNLMPRRFYLQTLIYIGVACIFLALSTPNPGTLHRYRVIYYPFLCLFFSGLFFEALKQAFFFEKPKAGGDLN